MCLAISNIRSAAQWNWDGDFIVHNPIIPALREIPHTRKRYEVDIREFIANRDNAVIKRAIDEIGKGLNGDERGFFLSHKEGSFDFRMRKVTEYLLQRVRYIKGLRRLDTWLFPEETLAKGSGDCEDRAFLLASLLLSSGISSYVVRVALGKLYNQRTQKSRDHVWVMYKNESGIWMLIEPLLHSEQAREKGKALRQKSVPEVTDTYEYVPYYVFNDSHLWSLKNNTIETVFLDYLKSRRFWKGFDPEFAASVHNHIFDLALDQLSWSDLLYVKGVSVAMDINPAIYDPRDHFDNGYISDSWKIANERLAEKTLDGLGHAAHTVADFYAHTSYAHFAKKTPEGELTLYDSQNTDDLFERPPDYGSEDFDLKDEKRFSVNDARCEMSREEAVNFWNKRKIISGRFAQPSDPHQGFLEKTFVYIPYALRHAPDFPPRTSLPHHDEIAVDKDIKGDEIPDKHKLYTSPADYSSQFRLRQAAAINHIKMIYEEWKREKTSDGI